MVLYQKIVKIIISECGNNYVWHWDDEFYDYIGWNATDSTKTHNSILPNGLYCGWDNHSRQNNIFRKNNFIYSSNNKNYKEKLPGIQTNDIIILQYDSNMSTLSFSKENDNGKLDSYIKNLPNGLTFYWFVGHFVGQMCLTVLD